MKIFSFIKNRKFYIPVLLIVTSTLLSNLCIKKYIEYKIEKKGYKVSIEEISIHLDRIDIKSMHLSGKGKKAYIKNISVFSGNECEYLVKIDGGDVYLDEVSPKEKGGGGKEFCMNFRNVKVEIDKYKGGKVSLNVIRANVNEDTTAFISEGSYVKDGMEIKASNMDYTSERINSERVTVKTTTEQINKLKDIKSGKPAGNGESKIINVKNLEAYIGNYEILGSDVSYNNKVFRFNRVSLNKDGNELVNSQGLEFSKTEQISIKANEVSGFSDSLSQSEIKLKDIKGKILLDTSPYSYELNVGPAFVYGTVSTNNGEIMASANLRLVECKDLIELTPESMKDVISKFTFSGNLSGGIFIDTKTPTVNIDLKNGCTSIKTPTGYRREDLITKFKRIVKDKDNKDREIVTGPNDPEWVSLDDISPYMNNAVLVSEDLGFYHHQGVLLSALNAALEDDIKSHKFMRGGSTISMQTAKNLWLSRNKTISRKYQELFLTFHLESILSKKEIMETYLNVIEFYPGEYGIRKAAMHYFSINPKNLSVAQAAYLASILPNPKQTPYDATGRVSKYRMAHIRRMISRMLENSMLTNQEAEIANKEWVIIGSPSPEMEIGEPEE